jgi:hypothetical protein
MDGRRLSCSAGSCQTLHADLTMKMRAFPYELKP